MNTITYENESPRFGGRSAWVIVDCAPQARVSRKGLGIARPLWIVGHPVSFPVAAVYLLAAFVVLLIFVVAVAHLRG